MGKESKASKAKEGKTQIIGVDFGYGRVKTRNTDEPTRVFAPMNSKPLIGADRALFYQDTWYLEKRFAPNPIADRTRSEDYWLHTLQAIGRELEQRDLHGCSDVVLGVGLPIGRAQSQADALREYLKRPGKQAFAIGDTEYEVSINEVFVISQGYAAALAMADQLEDVSEVHVVDIGSWTVDTMTFYDRWGAPDSTDTYQMGALTCYARIARDLARQKGTNSVTRTQVETVLCGGKTSLPEETCNNIRALCAQWCEDCLGELERNGISMSSGRCIFVGGGSQLIKNYFYAANPDLFLDVRFIDDLRANAIGYERYCGQQLNAQQTKERCAAATRAAAALTA